MMIDIAQLAAETVAMTDLFYTESCYYTRPLKTLCAIFGAENCRFGRRGDYSELVLHPCGLQFTVFVSDDKTEQELHEELAQCALQSLPPRRIVELVHKSLVLGDRTMAASPIAVKFPLSPPVGAKRSCPGSPPEGAAASSTDALRQRLVEFYNCDISFEFRMEHIEGAGSFIHCTVSTPRGPVEPYVLCTKSATALQHALLCALCNAVALVDSA